MGKSLRHTNEIALTCLEMYWSFLTKASGSILKVSAYYARACWGLAQQPRPAGIPI